MKEYFEMLEEISGVKSPKLKLPLSFVWLFAAVNELKKLHVTSLSFGCENEDPNMLLKIARAQLSDSYIKILKDEIKKGISF